MMDKFEERKNDLENILDIDVNITKRPTIITPEKPVTNSVAVLAESKELIKQFENLPRNLGEDFELSRNVIKEVVERGRELISEMITVSRASENPLMYQATATFLRTMVDSAKSLLEIQEKMNIITKGSSSGGQKEPTEGGGSVFNVNQAVFVGSTTEAIRQLKEAAKIIDTEFKDITDG